MIITKLYYKWLYRIFFYRNKNANRVLIYSVDSFACQIKDIFKNECQHAFEIVGFIGKNAESDKNVYAFGDITQDLVERKKISQIIIPINGISSEELIELFHLFEKLPIKIKALDTNSHGSDSKTFPYVLRDLTIEDLLGTKQSIDFEDPIVDKNFKNKTILVTGAAGSIGSEISHQLSLMDFGILVLVDQAESALYDLQQSLKYMIPEDKQARIFYIVGNIRDLNRMYTLFQEYKPNFVFHAAAYKHVPLMESFPYEAICTNIYGTKIIADLSDQFHIDKFIMVSTDKAVNPTNVMGATKKVAEVYVSCINKKSKTNYIITRFCNVLGSNGSVIPLFKKQLENGGPLTVTDLNIKRYFMTISEACNLVLQAGVIGKGGEIFAFHMGKIIRIIDLAKKMIRLKGLNYPKEIDIKIIGLRPGEKIHEELLANDEKIIKSYNNKFIVAEINTKNCNENKILIEELCSHILLKNVDIFELVSKIKEIIPEFKSQNSEFEKLD